MTVTLACLVLLASVVAGFILERRLMVRDVRGERLRWEAERSSLLNRIKPETSQPPPMAHVESFNAPELEGPNSDSEYWEDRE